MKPKVVVLGEKPQGATWLSLLIKSGQFDIIAGVERNVSSYWWDGECFGDILRGSGIPVVDRSELYHLNYDIIWSLMYGFIIEPALILKARYGLNLHESPLPRYRGCNGYSHAILEKSSDYGTSFQLLDPELDKGNLIDQELFAIHPDETAKDLYYRTTLISNMVFKRNINLVAQFQISTTPMNVEGEPIRERNSLDRERRLPSEELDDFPTLYRRVRALDFSPFQPCFFEYEGNIFYLFINNATGRFDHRHALNSYQHSESILKLCKGNSAYILSNKRRDIVVMESQVYANYYPLFIPKRKAKECF